MKNFPIILSFIYTAYIISFPASALTDTDKTDELWRKFLKYDLCISEYDALTEEEQDLCHFIFDTEHEGDYNIRCERARRTLAHDPDLGERLTYDELNSIYGVWDKYSASRTGYASYRHCVPDIKVMTEWSDYNEYWLDDDGTYIVMDSGENSWTIKESIVLHGPCKGYLGDLTDTLNEIQRNAIEQEIELKIKQPQEKPVSFTEENGEAYFYLRIPKPQPELHEIDGDLYYYAPDGTAVFWNSKYALKDYETKYMGQVTEPVTVPETVEGRTVTEIGRYAFWYAPVTEIVLPESVQFIDECAFIDCELLEKVHFPSGMRVIARNIIGRTAISSLTIDCPEALLAAKTLWSNATHMDINASVIGEHAVSGYFELESVTLGSDVQRIGAYAFRGSDKLKTINLPKNLEIIGQGAFLGTNIKAVTIPRSVRIIGALSEYSGIPATSGIEPKPSHPLTDEPVCAFESDCVISGYAGTEAERYAKEWGLQFIALEELDGDVNGDGTFSIADAVMLAKYLSNSEDALLSNWRTADRNQDNQLDARDLSILLHELSHTSKES